MLDISTSFTQTLMKIELLTTRSQTLDSSVNLKVEENEAGTPLSDYDMDSIPIKQEETSMKFENYNNNEKRNTSKVKRVVYLGCKHCNRKFLTRSLNDAHIKEEHNVDPESLDFYCELCGYKFTQRRKFREHLRTVHKMNIPRLRSKPNHDIEPDPNDPNFYCKSCDYKYKHNAIYRTHLRAVHKMNLPSLISKRNPGIEPDPDDPDFHCKSCDCKYKNISRYRDHLRQVHKMNLSRLRLKPNHDIGEEVVG